MYRCINKQIATTIFHICLLPVLIAGEESKPGYLESYKDPVFGTRVVRITGDPGTVIPVIEGTWGEVVRHGYSKEAAWNANGKLLLLRRNEAWPSWLFLDGKTYAPLFGRNDIPGTEARWHSSQPDIMVFVKDNKLGFWNVREDTTEEIAAFENYTELHIGPWEGNLSADGHRIALAGKHKGTPVAFVYDIEERRKFPDLDLKGMEVDWVSVSASGKFLVLNGNINNDRGDQTQIFDLQGNTIGDPWLDYGRPSHYDLTLDSDGSDIAVGVSKSKPDDGRVIKRRLSDGKVFVLTEGGYASHVSTRNSALPGWAFVTYQQRTDNWPPFVDEVVAVKLDGTEVRRIARMKTKVVDYLTEAHAVPSPDGRRVLWASAWEEPKGRPNGVFVAELPSFERTD